MKVVTFIALLLSLIATRSYAQDDVIPGRLVVEFQLGVLSMPDGVLTVAPSSSTVIVPAVLEALNSIVTVEIGKLFPSAVQGQTEVVSQITGQLEQIKDLSQYFIVNFDTQVPVASAVSTLRALPVVISATPDYYPILDGVPNDNLFNSQWHLQNNVNPKFDIDAVLAWDHSQGDNIKIAFIEAGVRDDHPDLQAHIWYGAGSEIGYDTTTSTGRHGTYVAGLAAAVTDNTTGVAGVAWDGLIVPRIGYSVCDKANDIEQSASVAGAHVINNSWHTHFDLPCLEDATYNAFTLGSIITNSMGNESNPNHIGYPGAYDDWVVSVGALLKVNNGDTLYVRPDQNGGSYIDLTAPGDSLWTTSPVIWNPDNGYYTVFGMTSASTPVVSGVAALVRARFPNKTNMEIMDILRESAVLFNGWENDSVHYGHGIVNAFYAVAPPAAPQNLTLTNERGNPRLNWDANTEPDLKEYHLYKELSINCFPCQVDTFMIPCSTSTYLDEWFDIGGRPPFDFVKYWVKAEDISDQESNSSNSKSTKGQSGIQWRQEADMASAIPEVYNLSPNFPNPFNPTTTIRYDLPGASYISLVIYDILGREVRTLLDRREEAGYKSFVWNGKDNAGNIASAGIYIYALKAWSQDSEKTYNKTRKMVLLR